MRDTVAIAFMRMDTKSKDVKDFATELAADFFKRCPPSRPQGGGSRAATLARAVDDVCQRAAAYQGLSKLGIYGKAKLGTEFKLLLKDYGYDPEFIDELTSRLLISMSGK